ncbi:MAG: type III polyketide synthase [Planctomycetota bacterium]
MSLEITGIGTAVPDHAIRQRDAASLAVQLANADPGRERALAALYRRSGIESRGSVLLADPGAATFAQEFFPPAAPGTGGPTTGERMARYATEAGRLAVAAARAGLTAAAADPSAVTHLVTCSCTGFASPGVDIDLLNALGLSPQVARLHVGFMGCHGAFNALRAAAAFATADPDAVVLTTCVELCSLHFQYGTLDDHVVANSLFADGAAAAVALNTRAGRPAPGPWRLLGQSSELLPGSSGDMGWLIGDTGFEMTLSPRVPALVAERLRPVVDQGLAACGLAAADVASWAVHPGGPRILAGVEQALGLPADALAVSRSVLASHGNMSSATILFILDRLAREAPPGPCVALAFGPGLTVELAVLERTDRPAAPVIDPAPRRPK